MKSIPGSILVIVIGVAFIYQLIMEKITCNSSVEGEVIKILEEYDEDSSNGKLFLNILLIMFL